MILKHYPFNQLLKNNYNLAHLHKLIPHNNNRKYIKHNNKCHNYNNNKYLNNNNISQHNSKINLITIAFNNNNNNNSNNNNN